MSQNFDARMMTGRTDDTDATGTSVSFADNTDSLKAEGTK